MTREKNNGYCCGIRFEIICKGCPKTKCINFAKYNRRILDDEWKPFIQAINERFER